jgi:hypothetical protein
MLVEASGLVAVVAAAVVAIPLLWAWWRAPRFGKDLTPITDGRIQPIQFRPGPPPLPEHDAESQLAGFDHPAEARFPERNVTGRSLPAIAADY